MNADLVEFWRSQSVATVFRWQKTQIAGELLAEVFP